MASRIKATDIYRLGMTLWRKLEMDELVDLIASRTGLNEEEVRQVLQELDGTRFFVEFPEPADETGRFGDLRPKD